MSKGNTGNSDRSEFEETTEDSVVKAIKIASRAVSRPQKKSAFYRKPARFTFRVLILTETKVADRLKLILAPFGYRLDVAEDGRKALDMLNDHTYDLIIGSPKVPGTDGFQFLHTARMANKTAEVPFLMILDSEKGQEVVKAFQLGSEDVAAINTNDVILRARIRVLLRLSAQRVRIRNEKRLLGIKVTDRTRKLEEITMATVAALEKATELSDSETGHHILRVANYSALFAERTGLDSALVEKIRLYAPLHDVGKVGVPDKILKKKGKFTDEEYDEMKKHTTFGFELLKVAQAESVACNIALSHHERMDGSGYPKGLQGDQIPVEAKIVAVADVFDAMTNDRCYKDGKPPSLALKLISEELAHQFDPAVVEAFVVHFDEVLEIFESCR